MRVTSASSVTAPPSTGEDATVVAVPRASDRTSRTVPAPATSTSRRAVETPAQRTQYDAGKAEK